jgi:SAM-dependent methyltransferase
MTPRELPVEQTLTYLDRVLPPPPATVLEVGCGRGDLARRLLDRGYRVTPLDPSLQAVAEAAAAGLDVVQADFLAHEGGPYDVVLFTRSLHHISPLEQAVERATRLVAPGGLVVGDEFARERVDRETAAWYFDTRDVVVELGLLPEDHHPGPDDPLERWEARFRHHGEPLATGEELLAALRARLQLVSVDERVPYLYRNFADHLPQTALGLRLATRVLEAERRRIDAGAAPWAGLRFVARVPD